ncbi:MAG: stringent starvation protein B, partial [Gammaproteobacteria bacterium]
MNSKLPYLIRALNQWILDNGMTPQILVEAGDGSARVPREYVRDGKIILNIAPQAVADLYIGDDLLTFHARFNGRPFEIQLPTRCVLGVFARETGKGMM